MLLVDVHIGTTWIPFSAAEKLFAKLTLMELRFPTLTEFLVQTAALCTSQHSSGPLPEGTVFINLINRTVIASFSVLQRDLSLMIKNGIWNYIVKLDKMSLNTIIFRQHSHA